MKTKYQIIAVVVVIILVLFFLYQNMGGNSTYKVGLVSSEKNMDLNYEPLFTDNRVEETEDRIIEYRAKIGTEGNKDYYSYIDIAAQESNLGRGEEVLKNLNLAIAVDPTNPVAYDNIGTMFERVGAYKSALNAFNEALKVSPNSAYTYMQIIDLHKSYLNSSFEVTDKVFKDALLATNNDLQIMKDYAAYLEENKFYNEALALWQKAYDLEKDPVAREIVFEQIGRLSEKIRKDLNM